MDYALEKGPDVLTYYEEFFNVSFPLPKQDMIAIPDFVSGAMEHWGLITYRETNLLYDDRESSSANKQRVATVVSHELAHQWFGNLVTLKVRFIITITPDLTKYKKDDNIVKGLPTKTQLQITIILFC